MVVAQLGNFQKRFSMKYIKTILLIFNAQEKKNVAKLLLATLIMGFLETIGVISIVPFMSVVTDPETIQKNEYLSFIYNYLDFQNI